MKWQVGELAMCGSKLPNSDDGDPCIIEESQDEPLLYVSPFLWGCHEAMERLDGDDVSLRHVRCDEYSIERNSKRSRTRTMQTVPSPKLQYGGVQCRIATGSSPRS